jgi:beta-lactamase regulating signal transducer with metallopeptidase domain
MLDVLVRLKEKFRVRASIALKVSSEVYTPMSFGIFSHTTILPEGLMDNKPDHDLEMILTHELAHIKRRDCLTNILQNILRVFFFFHPIFHLMNRRLAREREHICDDWVIQVTERRGGYAECILRLLEKALRPPVKALVTIGLVPRRQSIARRIDMIMDRRRAINTKCSGKALIVVLIVGCLALFTVGGIVLIRRPASDEAVSTDDVLTPEMQGFGEFIYHDNPPDPAIQKLLYQAVVEAGC